MGQLRQAHCPVGAKPGLTLRGKMLGPLALGFTFSAITVFALMSVAGGLVGGSSYLSQGIVAIVLVLCAIIDLAYPRVRPTLMYRQTPRSLAGRVSLPVTGALWGLDTGTVVSTFRVSAASWGALIVTFGGWGPWWAGSVYAVAFCGPLILLIGTYPASGGEGRGWRERSTESLVRALGRPVRYLRYAAAFTCFVGVAAAIETLF
jgi:hypothetical protein